MCGDSLPDFAGKVVMVYPTHKPDADGEVLCDPRFEQQGGRLFLLGTPAPGTTVNNWLEGRTVAVAWDTIDVYCVFNSLNDYLERRSKAWKEARDEHGNPTFKPI